MANGEIEQTFVEKKPQHPEEYYPQRRHQQLCAN